MEGEHEKKNRARVGAMEGEHENKDGGDESSFNPATIPPPLPPRITFRPLDARFLADLKALNSALFPINYGPKVYEQALAAGGISHGAFFDEEELVGAIMVRLESGPKASATAAPAASLFVPVEGGGEEGKKSRDDNDFDGGLARMYVMTVGVLSPWRGKGIGTTLLTNALSMAAEDEGIGVAYLHAHVSNSEALAFYDRLGFRKGGTARGYYRRLSPPDALVLWRRLR